MRITVAMARGRIRARLSESLDISSVEEAKDKLLQLSNSSNSLELNLSGMERLDTAGIQLLLALRRRRENRNQTLRISHPSGEVAKILFRAGLSRIVDEAVVSHREESP
ncbi:MAG: STAS domain-containing protein [Fibrobacteria bacterium]|nr:STAS domain-containing protein [Fibrobacteria bacterium]